MPLYKAQISMQAFTNLPTDRYTNTMHFVYDEPNIGVVGPPLANDIEAFYDAWGANIPAYVSRTVTLNLYKLSDPPPRVPFTTTFTIPASTGSAQLPTEACIVLGYRAALPHTGRRRNRLFLGPFNDTVLTAGSASSFPFVASGTRTGLLTAAQNLHVQSTAAPLSGEGWVVYSPTAGETYPIAQFYIDGEMDTQRRRGYRTTDRTVVPAL